MKESGSLQKLGEPGKEVEAVWACDAKITALCGKKDDGNGSKTKKEETKPKKILYDSMRDDIKEKGLSGEDVYDRATWRGYIVVHRPHMKVGL